MKLVEGKIDGIRFYHREGFSDLKTFEEVIGNKTYLKKGMTIERGERWMDCGGNVGGLLCWPAHSVQMLPCTNLTHSTAR